MILFLQTDNLNIKEKRETRTVCYNLIHDLYISHTYWFVELVFSLISVLKPVPKFGDSLPEIIDKHSIFLKGLFHNEIRHESTKIKLNHKIHIALVLILLIWFDDPSAHR